jgi:RecA-family ATPase
LSFLSVAGIRSQEILRHIENSLEQTPRDLVVIDSFGDAFTGSDLNNNAAMRNSLRPLNAIAVKYNCLILIIHHVTKSASDKAPKLEHVLGASAFGQVMRSILYLKDGPESTRYLALVKANYSPKHSRENSLVLKFSEETFLFTNTDVTVQTNSLEIKPGFRVVPNDEEDKKSELMELASKIFGEQTISHGEFIKRFTEATTQSDRTANRKLERLLESGLVGKTSDGYNRTIANQTPSVAAPSTHVPS